MTETALVVRGLSVAFGGVKAVDDVTFHLEAGSVGAVVGPNGAGKSTLLNSVSGLVRVFGDSEIGLFGDRLDRLSPAARARAGVGRSFQDPVLLDDESVLENLLCGANLTLSYGPFDQLFRRGKVRRAEGEATERARELMALAGLVDALPERLGGLSYGTRKLVDIVRATMGHPRLLLLDEPTSGLDHGEQAAVVDLVRAVAEASGVTILLVEHHFDIVRSVADVVIGLEAGRMVAFGSTDEVMSSPEFAESIYGAVKEAP